MSYVLNEGTTASRDNRTMDQVRWVFSIACAFSLPQLASCTRHLDRELAANLLCNHVRMFGCGCVCSPAESNWSSFEFDTCIRTPAHDSQHDPVTYLGLGEPAGD